MTKTDFHALLGPGAPDAAAPPAPLTGRELEALLSPLTPEAFATDHFARQSLNVEGPENKFAHIFSWARLKQALARGETLQDRRFNLMASFAAGEADGSRRPMFEVQIPQVTELLTAGATICITNIHMADPALARWAQALRTQLNFSGTVGVNCYVSPDGAGLPMHYDRRVATTLQIAGRKRWTFSTEAARPWPDANATFKDGQIVSAAADPGTPPADMTFRTVELSPGDLLCLPAGAWHSARGIGVSLALNVYFAPRNLFDQLAPLLLEFAAANGQWRGGPPATFGAIDGEMPPPVAAYMRARLDEFYTQARAIIDTPEGMARPWLDALTDGPYTGWAPDPVQPLPRATAEDRFRVARAAPLRFIETGDTLALPCDDGILTFPATLAPILRRMTKETGGFTLPQIIAWPESTDGLPPKDIILHLQTLYRNGLLEMV